MNFKSFDIKLLFLSFLDSYQNRIHGDSLSPIFKFLCARGAFAITAERLPEEMRKEFLEIKK